MDIATPVMRVPMDINIMGMDIYSEIIPVRKDPMGMVHKTIIPAKAETLPNMFLGVFSIIYVWLGAVERGIKKPIRKNINIEK